MDSVSGVSIRLASASCWLFLCAATTAYTVHVALWSPLSLSPMRFLSPLFAFGFHTSVFMLYVYSLLPMLMQWWFSMNPTASSTAFLSKLAKRMPGWRLGLWIKTPLQAVKGCILLITTSTCGWFFVQQFAALYSSKELATAHLWYIGAPAGIAHVAFYMDLGMYHVEYPIMHRKRWLRLKDKLPAVASVAVASWMLSLPMAVLLFFFSNVPVPDILQLCAALLGSLLCCLLWSCAAAINTIVLSERLSLRHYEARQQISVCYKIVRCDTWECT